MSNAYVDDQTFAPGAFAGNTRALRWLIWSGMVCLAILGPAMLLARVLPLPAATLSAEQIAHRWVEHKNSIRLGCVLMMLGISLWATYCAAISYWIRRMEQGVPILTYLSLILPGTGTVLFLLAPFLWSVAAFRPETMSPDVILALNDAACLAFIWLVGPFIIQFALYGIAILQDKSAPNIFPRWVGYLNIFFSIECFCGLTTASVKSGPLSWTGVISFWNVMAVFAIWLVTMTVTMLRALRSLEARQRTVSESEPVLALR